MRVSNPYVMLPVVVALLWGVACEGEGPAAEDTPPTPDVVSDGGADLDGVDGLDGDVTRADAPSDALEGDGLADAADVAGDAEDIDGETSDVVEVIDAAPDVPPPPPPLPAAPAWFHQVHLPEVVMDANGESETLWIPLPAETTSVFFMVRGEEDKAFFNLKTVVTPPPLNQIVVKGAGDGVCIPCANRVSAAQKVAAFLIPNDPGIAVTGGEWEFRLRSTGVLKTPSFIEYPPLAGVCEVFILARTEPIPDVGHLRLHLHFTGSDGLTAETAPTDERLQQGLDEAAMIFATIGLSFSVEGYHDVEGVEEDPALSDLQSTLGAPNDFSKLLLKGQADDLRGLNVFFVSSIFKDEDFGGGGIVLGVSAGVPGPAFIGPSYRSGVAIATFDLEQRLDFFGNVLAHEMGHFLGLYHSTEKNSLQHDTIDDTAEDDPTNMMFWAYSPDQKLISESQGVVMRSHPLVLAPEEPSSEPPEETP